MKFKAWFHVSGETLRCSGTGFKRLALSLEWVYVMDVQKNSWL